MSTPTFHSPLSTENEGTFCLAVPAKAMAEVWETQDDQIKITAEINIEREMENGERPLFDPQSAINPWEPRKREKISAYNSQD